MYAAQMLNEASGQEAPAVGTHATFSVVSTFDGLDGAVAVTATVRAVVPGAAVGVGGAMIPAMASAPVEHSR